MMIYDICSEFEYVLDFSDNVMIHWNYNILLYMYTLYIPYIYGLKSFRIENGKYRLI